MRNPFVRLVLPALGLYWLFFFPHSWLPDPAIRISMAFLSALRRPVHPALYWQLAFWIRALAQIGIFLFFFRRLPGPNPFRPGAWKTLLPRALVWGLVATILAMVFALPFMANRFLAMTEMDRFGGPALAPSPRPSPLPDSPSGSSLGPYPAPLALLPALFITALCTGYREELFFRFYLARALALGMPIRERSGFHRYRPFLLVALQALLFATAHARSGPRTFLFSLAIGIAFGLRARKRQDVHELALGHAFYDFPILVTYSLGGLPF